MDVPPHKRIKMVSPRRDRSDFLGRQHRQHEPICDVNAELVAAAPPTGVTMKARVDALRCVSWARGIRDASARHPHVDEAAVRVPNRVDASPELRNQLVGPLCERMQLALRQFGSHLVGEWHSKVVIAETGIRSRAIANTW